MFPCLWSNILGRHLDLCVWIYHCSFQRSFHRSGIHTVNTALALYLISFSVRHVPLFIVTSGLLKCLNVSSFHYWKLVSLCKLGMTDLWRLFYTDKRLTMCWHSCNLWDHWGERFTVYPALASLLSIIRFRFVCQMQCFLFYYISKIMNYELWIMTLHSNLCTSSCSQ